MTKTKNERYSEEAARLYQSGLSSRDIAKKFDCCKTTVLKALHAAGVEMRTPPREGGRHTSEARAKMGSHRENHPQWNGGIKVNGNRILVHSAGHPAANVDGYVYRSRIVMEMALHRFLDEDEVVHHINGDSFDDRKDNLKLFPSSSEHMIWHTQTRHFLGILDGIKDPETKKIVPSNLEEAKKKVEALLGDISTSPDDRERLMYILHVLIISED